MTPKISVIVPVYKVEKYLPKCIDSILAQTFTDFELLLIDDGSPDNSGAICDEYAKKDSRIRVFHKENGGVSSARNLGLDEAKGEWIAFVDGDDWLPSSALELLYSKAELTGADIVCGDHEVIYDNGTTQYRNRGEYNALKRDSYFDLIFNKTIYSLWEKLYKKSLFYPELIEIPRSVNHGEDFLKLLQLVDRSSKIAKVDSSVYSYVMRGDSSTHTFKFRSENEYYFFKYFCRITDAIEFESSFSKRFVKNKQLSLAAKYISSCEDGDPHRGELFDFLVQGIKQTPMSLLDFRTLLQSYSSIYSSTLYHLVVKLFDFKDRLFNKLARICR